jgi:hypothetical protein
MIKLFDRYGNGTENELKLLKTRAVDDSHYATRRDIRAVIDAVTERGATQRDGDGEPLVHLTIRSARPSEIGITPMLEVGVTYEHGILRLGCHPFSKVNSRRIIRWA